MPKSKKLNISDSKLNLEPIVEEKPKMPLTAYALYVRDVRMENNINDGEEEDEEEDEKNQVWTRQCLAEWNDLPEEYKQNYRDRAAQSKKIYYEDMKLWRSQTQSDKKKKKKRTKEFPTLKRPSTAYIFFCNEQRGDLKRTREDWTVVEMSRALGMMWRNLDAEEKAKYYSMANNDQERYRVELLKLREEEKKNMVDEISSTTEAKGATVNEDENNTSKKSEDSRSSDKPQVVLSSVRSKKNKPNTSKMATSKSKLQNDELKSKPKLLTTGKNSSKCRSAKAKSNEKVSLDSSEGIQMVGTLDGSGIILPTTRIGENEEILIKSSEIRSVKNRSNKQKSSLKRRNEPQKTSNISSSLLNVNAPKDENKEFVTSSNLEEINEFSMAEKNTEVKYGGLLKNEQNNNIMSILVKSNIEENEVRDCAKTSKDALSATVIGICGNNPDDSFDEKETSNKNYKINRKNVNVERRIRRTTFIIRRKEERKPESLEENVVKNISEDYCLIDNNKKSSSSKMYQENEENKISSSHLPINNSRICDGNNSSNIKPSKYYLKAPENSVTKTSFQQNDMSSSNNFKRPKLGRRIYNNSHTQFGYSSQRQANKCPSMEIQMAAQDCANHKTFQKSSVNRNKSVWSEHDYNQTATFQEFRDQSATVNPMTKSNFDINYPLDMCNKQNGVMNGSYVNFSNPSYYNDSKFIKNLLPPQNGGYESIPRPFGNCSEYPFNVPVNNICYKDGRNWILRTPGCSALQPIVNTTDQMLPERQVASLPKHLLKDPRMNSQKRPLIEASEPPAKKFKDVSTSPIVLLPSQGKPNLSDMSVSPLVDLSNPAISQYTQLSAMVPNTPASCPYLFNGGIMYS